MENNERYNQLKACPICNSQMLHGFCEKEIGNLIICDQCRHIFWDKRPSQKELQAYYAERYSNEHHQKDIQSEEREYYKSHVNELLNFTGLKVPDATLVDYGCSYPVLLQEAQKQGLNTIGVEWDSECINVGKRYGIKMMTPDMFLRDIENESVDIIRFSHVIEHMVDPVQTLKEASRKLRINGMVYITQPNLPVFVSRHCDIDIKDSVYPEHLHFFSPISLIKMVEKCGLAVTKLFTHQKTEEVFEKFMKYYDFKESSLSLHQYASLGDDFFGKYANYPLYCGENSVMWATRKN